MKFIKVIVTATLKFPFNPENYIGVEALFDSEDNPNVDAVLQYEKESIVDDPMAFFEGCEFEEKDVKVEMVDEEPPKEHPVGGVRE